MCLEGIETSAPLHLNNNNHSGITHTCKDKIPLNTTCQMPRDGWTTPLSPWTSTRIGWTADKEITAAKETKHCQSNQYNRTANLIDFNQSYDGANIIEEDPVKTLQTQLNSLSTQDREKLAITMGGGDQQDFPSA